MLEELGGYGKVALEYDKNIIGFQVARGWDPQPWSVRVETCNGTATSCGRTAEEAVEQAKVACRYLEKENNSA
jgi:hypothetical protein